MKKKRPGWGIWLVGIIYASLLLMTFKSDYLKISGRYDMYGDASGYVECIDDRNWVINQAPEDMSGVSQIMNLPMYSRKAGCYTLDLTCDTENAGGYIEITTDGVTLPDNTVQKVILRQPLQPDQKAYSLKYRLPGYCQNIAMQVYYPGKGYFNIGIPYYCSTFKYYHDSEFMLICTFIAAALFLWWYRKTSYKKLYRLSTDGDLKLTGIGITVLSVGEGLIASIPYLGTALDDSVDLQFHFMRIMGLAGGLASGQFPVRVQPYWIAGYGYPVSMFYPDLFLYIPAALIAMGVSELMAFKVFVVLINMITVWFSFQAFRRLLRSDTMGIIISVFYELSMYRFLNLYNRCDIAEVLAMIFMPWVLYGMYSLLWGNVRDSRMLVIGIFGVFGSHILSIEFSGILCLLMLAAGVRQLKEKARIQALLRTIILCLLMNAYFIIPFICACRLKITMLQYGASRIDETGVFLSQMFNTFVITAGGNNWGTSTAQEMPLSFGILTGIVLLLYVYISYSGKYSKILEQMKWKRIAEGSFLGGLFFVWMSSDLFPWHYVKRIPLIGRVLSTAQFAWRYYMLATVLLCIVIGIVLYVLLQERIGRKAIIIVCAILALLNVSPFIDDYGNTHKPYMADKYAYTFRFDEYCENRDYLYEDVETEQMRERPQIIISSMPAMKFDNYAKRGTDLSFNYHKGTEAAESEVQTTDLYYPGYTAWINGNRAEISEGEDHILNVKIPQNVPRDGTVTVKYTGFWYYRVADIISLITVAGVVWGILKRRCGKKIPNSVCATSN